MYHIVYLTTNIINHKIYIGVHSTYDLDDGYLGSGKLLYKAIKKYGKKSFKNEILFYCLEAIHAYEIEEQIVNQHFIDREDVYNIKVGGTGGDTWSTNPDFELFKSNMSKTIKNLNLKHTEKFKQELSDMKKDLYKDKTKNPNYGKKASIEKLQKQSEGLKKFYENEDNRIEKSNSLRKIRQKNYQLITPNGNISFTNLNDIMDWCRSQKFAWQSLYKSYKLNRKLMSGKMKDYQLCVLD